MNDFNTRYKFRVWNTVEKQFFTTETKHDWPYLGLDGKLYWLDGGGGMDELDESYIISQYTGLKDKNGQEIYEGDIIRQREFDGWWTDDTGFDYIGVVRYNLIFSCDGDTQFSGFVVFPNLRENRGYSGLSLKRDCEIIGNVHENPEIVKYEN